MKTYLSRSGIYYQMIEDSNWIILAQAEIKAGEVTSLSRFKVFDREKNKAAFNRYIAKLGLAQIIN